jgi:hypothetical protein
MTVSEGSVLRRFPIKWEMVTFYNVAFVGLVLLAGAAALTWVSQAGVAVETGE